jgi:glycosyltransferase involved in cell wall biosynthesis
VPATLDVLFLLESNLGPAVMGHSRLQEAVELGGAARPGVRTRFAGLPALAGAVETLAKPAGRLGVLDLDLQATRWHAIQSLRARREIGRLLGERPADVVYVLSHAIGLAAPSLTPVVLSVDIPIAPWNELAIWRRRRPWSRAVLGPSLALERRAFRRASLVHAWTAWTAARVREAQPRAEVLTAHPGLDLERLRPAAREPRARPRVLFVGGRFAAKGGHDLLAALAPMLGTDVELDLVTPEPVPERDGVRRHELGPYDPELLALFQQADVLALPSYGDAVPWVVVEAMACATPVVASTVGAIPELLGDGAAGTTVAPGDVAALSRELAALLGDPGRRAAMGAAGRARCEERYDARVQAPLLLDRMASLTAAPHPA